MATPYRYTFLLICILFLTFSLETQMKAQITSLVWMKDSQAKLEKELSAKFGDSQQPRIQKGLKQVADFWRVEDGDAAAFEDFVRTNFAGDQTTLDVMFNRFENLFEQLSGHMNEIGLAFRQQSDLELGPIYPFDEIFAAYSPDAHITDDFFKNKLAFIVLLNFPLTTLNERLVNGEQWSRRRAAALLAMSELVFSGRITLRPLPKGRSGPVARRSGGGDRRGNAAGA